MSFAAPIEPDEPDVDQMLHYCPLEECFENFYDIIHRYNVDNDTLTMECPMEEWSQRFLRVQSQFRNYYRDMDEFSQTLDADLRKHLHRDVTFYNDTLTLQTVLNDSAFVEQCPSLEVLRMCWKFYSNQTLFRFDDNRLLAEIVEKLLPDLERKMPRSEVTLAAYSLLAQTYGDMVHLQVKQYAEECVHYLEKVQSFDDRFESLSTLEQKKMVLRNYYNAMLNVGLLNLEVYTLEDAYKNYNKVLGFLSQHSQHLQKVGLGSRAGMAYNRCKSYPQRVLRYYVLRIQWETYDEGVRAQAQKELQRLERKIDQLDALDYYYLCNLKTYLGMQSFEESWKLAYDYYKTHPSTETHLGMLQLGRNVDALGSLVFILDKAALVPDEERAEAIKSILGDVAHQVAQAHTAQYRNLMAMLVARVLKDSKFFQGLDAASLHAFIYRLMPYTHTRTLAFTQMSARIGLCLVNYAMKDHPECFVGMNGCLAPEDIASHKELQSYIFNRFCQGALIHDIGYNAMIDVVKNDYRPLNAKEFDIMTMHCERGVEFLNMTPDLRSYKDFVLGHHKWYNGRRGYPAWFSLQQSKDKFLVEVLHLSEFLSFPLSGNGKIYYDEMFRFDALMERVDHLKGVRFNPVLVDMIHEDKHLNQKLRELVEEGWKEIFYNVYRVYFPSFNPETYQMASWLYELEKKE